MSYGIMGAYRLVADQSDSRMMTQQRAQRLSDFASSVGKKGKDRTFRCFKNESTLVTYFRKAKELLAYYYRVVYRSEGHFTRSSQDRSPGQSQSQSQRVHEHELPQDVIEPTADQQLAMESIFETLRRQDARQRRQSAAEEQEGQRRRNREDDREVEELQPLIRRMLLALIGQTVGSKPFQSPLLSYCAMHARSRLRTAANRARGESKRGTGNDEADEATRRRAEQAAWKEPGNYTSHLSAMVWTAQLVLFESVCDSVKDTGSCILDALQEACESYMHQKHETVYGCILQWRLYLSATAQSQVSRTQARWSLCGGIVTRARRCAWSS